MAETREYFRGVGGVFRLRIRDDAEPVSDAPFLGAGLKRRGGIPCLAPTSIGREEAPFEIRAVLDEERSRSTSSRRRGVRVVAPRPRAGVPAVAAPCDGWHAYVGYRDGVAVTTAQLIVEDGTAGLYYMAR